jgi:hypothetical protein
MQPELQNFFAPLPFLDEVISAEQSPFVFNDIDESNQG